MEQREEGGNNGFVWQLPTRMKYTNIKLSRPIGPDSATAHEMDRQGAQRPYADHRRDLGAGRRGKARRGMDAHGRGPRSLDRPESEFRLAEGVHRDP